MKLSDVRKSGLNYNGIYNSGITYNKGSVVSYNNKSYVCRVSSSFNVLPTNTTNWGVLSDSATVGVSTTGTGTNPALFTLGISGNTVVLNKG